jgi:hypothetical protein
MTSTLSTAEVISQSAERWKNAAGFDETTLLRLAILRDLARHLHTERSRSLAHGKKDQVANLKNWEAKAEELRKCSPLDGDLQNLLEGKVALQKRTRLLPDQFFTHMDRAKIERYDRQWEYALAAEACFIRWKFWALETWVHIPEIQNWNQKLEDILWPNGVVLFSENVSKEMRDDMWNGRWILILHSKYRTPEELSLGLDRWVGSPEKPPTPTKWKMLFSPK